MTSAKIFDFTSMLTMLHEVISNGHQNFNVSYKSKMQSSQFFETKKCNIVCILQLYCIEVQSVRNILQNNSEQEWILIHFPWLVDKLYTECIVFMYVRITCNKKMKLTKIDCKIYMYLHDNYHVLFFFKFQCERKTNIMILMIFFLD